MTFVLNLTKQSIDIFDGGLTPNDYIIKSNLNTFKILAEGTLLNQTVNSNPTTFSVAHGLPFTPNFYAYCLFPDGKVALAGPLSFIADRDTRILFIGPSFTPEVDDTNLYFKLTKPAGNYDVDISYKIFEVPL